MNEFKKKANAAGERLLRGVPSALEEIIDMYQKKIYNLAYQYTGDREEAFDLSQEIFTRLYLKIKLFSSKSNFNAWFMQLAVNTAINYKAKLKRNPSNTALEFNPNNIDLEHCKSTDKTEQGSIHEIITSLLTQLPKRDRMAIMLQLWERKKVKEIAEIMDISVKAVESLLTRARKRLKKIKNEGFST